MAKFGICARMTDLGIQPAPLARWAQSAGFESLWFGEHTHAPVRGSDHPERDAQGFDQLYDPYACLAVAATVTDSLKLGLAVSLVPQHHPIVLAKSIATLDRISNGRIIFGIGAGSVREEVEDFGIPFAERWRATREYIRAIKAIWGNDVAHFKGNYVSFGPLKSWPKPLLPGGPPILEGAFSPHTAQRIAEYGDGWIAWGGTADAELIAILELVKARWEVAGRGPQAPDLTIILPPEADDKATQARIDTLLAAGFERLVLLMTPGEPESQWAELARYANLRQHPV